MGIKRIVDVSFWTDRKVDDFSPEDRYFMLYLLTNPFSKQLGIYEISIRQAAFQMGYSEDAFRVLLDRFENKYHMILFSKETSEVAIMNFLRHSVVKGGAPVRDCLIKEIKQVKNKELIAKVFAHIKDYPNLNATVKGIISEYEEKNGILRYCNEGRGNDTSPDTSPDTLDDSYDNDNENENDNDNENENDSQGVAALNESSHESSQHKELYASVIAHLNEKAGTKYKATTPKTQTLIRARANEGFTLDDFIAVIDMKCAEWLADKKMVRYLRPETLFGTKFEGYLNEKHTKELKNNGNGGNRSVDQESPAGRVGTWI